MATLPAPGTAAVAAPAASPQPRLHPIVSRSHGPRMAAQAMASVVCASTLLDRGWWYPAAVILLGTLWPQVANRVARRASDSRAAGRRNLLGDALVAGLWAGLAGFAALPAGIVLAIIGGFLIMMGGRSLFLSGLPLMGVGLALGFAVSGFHPLAPIGALTTWLCVAQVALTFIATASAVNSATKDLIFVRRDLRRAVSEISSIADLARTLNSTLDERHVLEAISQALMPVFPFDQLGFYRYDKATNRLTPRALTGPGLPADLAARLMEVAPSMAGAFGLAVESGQPQYFAHLTQEFIARMEPSDRELHRLNPVQSLLILPLSVTDEVIGVIVFTHTRERVEVGPAEIDTIGRYVMHLATALRNAQLFEEAELARAAANEANDAKSRFLANMSHELRTPLNGILGYAQLLHRDRELTPDQRLRVDGIERSGTHLLGLINDVLDLSKIEAGGLDIDPEPTNLRRLVQDVADIVRPRADNARLRFTAEVGPNVPAGIRTDGPKLRQVLVNLLGNAVKFTREGSVGLTVTRPSPQGLCFEVADSGQGIPLAQLDEIFEPFKQADAGKRQGGTGLGLAISRRLVEALGGNLQVQSEVGRGSTFTVRLPVSEAAAAELAALDADVRREARQFRLAPGQDVTVLVVDDNETNREILTGLLLSAGFHVVEAVNGEDALRRQREGRYPLVLMDLVMPVMDGTTATQALRREPDLARTIVIAVSASVLTSDRRRALDAGFDDFLSKPLRASELFEKLETHLCVRYAPSDGGSAAVDVAATTTASPFEIEEARTLARRLQSAVDEGDVNTAESIGETVRSLGHVPLADRIVAHAREFDFEALQVIVSELDATPRLAPARGTRG